MGISWASPRPSDGRNNKPSHLFLPHYVLLVFRLTLVTLFLSRHLDPCHHKSMPVLGHLPLITSPAQVWLVIAAAVGQDGVAVAN